MQHHWSPQKLQSESSAWCYQASAQLIGELAVLERSIQGRIDDIDPDQIRTARYPAINALAAQVKAQLGPEGLGVAKLSGLLPRDSHLATASIAIASAMGTLLEPYGKLYPVYDRGGCYRTQTIPVSQTGQPIAFHTDSARLDMVPDVISLSCVRDAMGGNTRLVSMARVYEVLMTQCHETIERLHQSYVRAIVTPGTDSDHKSLMANRFPIFSANPSTRKLTFRYMRYWIEQGQHLSGHPIDPWTNHALDWLDSILSSPDFFFEYHLVPGEIMWVDNRDIAHARTPHQDTAPHQRLLYRTWISL